MIDGVNFELKTLTGTSVDTAIKRIKNGFKQGENVLLDARQNPLINAEEVERIFKRLDGIFRDGLPGKVEIWTVDGIFRR